jgi:hypothetical protein
MGYGATAGLTWSAYGSSNERSKGASHEQPAARRAMSPHRSSQRSRSGYKRLRRELLKGWGEVRGIEEYYVDPAALAPCVT